MRGRRGREERENMGERCKQVSKIGKGSPHPHPRVHMYATH